MSNSATLVSDSHPRQENRCHTSGQLNQSELKDQYGKRALYPLTSWTEIMDLIFFGNFIIYFDPFELWFNFDNFRSLGPWPG